MKVGIIGAGVSGLSMIRSLKNKGIACVAFEKANNIGGVWRENYIGMRLQVPKELYEFPDFRFTEGAPGAHSERESVQRYVEAFADKYALKEHVRLGADVQKIERNGDKWTIAVKGNPNKEVFDSIVVCTGMYSSTPFIPELPGRKEFEQAGAKVLHSSEFKDAALVKGKNVVVIGGGKSATEATMAVKDNGAASTTMLYRKAHWGTPHKIAGIIPFQYVFLSRFGQCLVSLYKGVWPGSDSNLLKSSHKLLAPVMGPVFSIVEAIFAAQLGHYGDFRPKRDVVKDFYSVPYLMSPTFINRVNAKEIVLKNGEISKLTASKQLELKDGKGVIPCDVLICATGFQKSYDIFAEDVKRDLHVDNDGLYLYRHAVPPTIKGLYFCGSEVSCIFNVASYAIQAEWISQVIAGTLKLPQQEKMLQSVEEYKQWKRSWMPETSSRASLVLLHHTHFHDELLRDMGVNPKRKSNPVFEAVAPYYPRDYDGFIKPASAVAK